MILFISLLVNFKYSTSIVKGLYFVESSVKRCLKLGSKGLVSVPWGLVSVPCLSFVLKPIITLIKTSLMKRLYEIVLNLIMNYLIINYLIMNMK